MITEWRWLFNIYFRTRDSQIAGHDILKSRFGTLYSQFPWAGIVEEHNVIGGLGEAVAAVVAENYPVPVYRIGVNDRFGHSGPATELLKEYGLDSVGIVDTVLKMRSRTQPKKSTHQ